MIADFMSFIINNIKDRFVRSSLTILSILIGIMAVYALVSFGQGVGKYVNDVGQQAGADKIFVQPKGAGAPGSTGTYLTDHDLNVILKVNGVKGASGLIMGQAEVNNRDTGTGKYVFVMGLSTDPQEREIVESAFAGFKIMEGRPLKKGDTNKVTVGYSYMVANKLFPKPLNVGNKLYINEIPYEIVGIYESIGNAGDDSNVYMTKESAKALFGMKEYEYGYIYVQAQPGVDTKILADKISEKLRKDKGEKKGQETTYVASYQELLKTFSTVLNVLNGILVIIAGISVLVASVNIMNTMYTAVMERTREIGIMKAIGARNSYIMLLFFFESGMLGLIGGALGIMLGYGLAKMGGAIAAGAGYGLLKPYFPWWLTVGCLVFSFLIGAGSGFFPARQASKLKPVDALRYE